MRDIDPRRFLQKKPEEFEFQGQDIIDTPHPKLQPGAEPTSERADARRDGDQAQAAAGGSRSAYIVTIPRERRKVRHPFDIHDDQLEALKKLQIAILEVAGAKAVPTLGDMVREALDDYLEKLVERSPNVRLIREQDGQSGE